MRNLRQVLQREPFWRPRKQTWIQDLLLQDQDQDQDSEVPRPRLWRSKTKTKTKTLMSKTKTETQDLQDQYWKSMTRMDCDKQKRLKSNGKQKIQHTSSYTVNNKTSHHV